ncbi:hypothetical protein [Actinokineospora iranica]|uniref:Uncharacterized protein n=1 Tax=Actinokineospora iranica TaxID=1271860 RepID=A0A1G6M8C3_9PSEU|nr:hypothetical protein [Actinokineospora iranica]SDC51195.1 hypothetical protein SAMN05216174_102400 [Actinokineospora iranica]
MPLAEETAARLRAFLTSLAGLRAHLDGIATETDRTRDEVAVLIQGTGNPQTQRIPAMLTEALPCTQPSKP